MTIAISNKISDEERTFYEESFKDIAQYHFLNGLPANEQEEKLSLCNLLISRNPTVEMPGLSAKAFKNISFVQLLSAGFDHLDFSKFPSTCVVAGNMGAYAYSMAEHGTGMILALAKELLNHHHEMQDGIFNQFNSQSQSIFNKTIGIIGFGGIGQKIAKIFQEGFDCKVYAVNTSGVTDKKVDWIGTLQNIDHLLKESDFIVITIPLTAQTENLIGAKELSLVKDDAILINLARGQIINEKALFEKLSTTETFKVGIDAWWTEPFFVKEFSMNYPFLKMKNVLGSPHNSAMVSGMLLESSKLGVANVLKYIKTGKAERILDLSDHKTFY